MGFRGGFALTGEVGAVAQYLWTQGAGSTTQVAPVPAGFDRWRVFDVALAPRGSVLAGAGPCSRVVTWFIEDELTSDNLAGVNIAVAAPANEAGAATAYGSGVRSEGGVVLSEGAGIQLFMSTPANPHGGLTAPANEWYRCEAVVLARAENIT